MERPALRTDNRNLDLNPVLPRLDGIQLRVDAERCEMLDDHEIRDVMDSISDMLKGMTYARNTVPVGVYLSSVVSLVHEWNDGTGVLAGRVSDGSIIVRSCYRDALFESNFVILDGTTARPVASGFVTDRGIAQQWPTQWSDYSDLRGGALLDVCCGGGSKVHALRDQGVDAHGVDIGIIGDDNPRYLHFGRAENLPFVDETFDRVESRMGAIWMQQESLEATRKLLSEMIRVTRDGGTIRIFPTKEEQLHSLVAERHDSWIYTPHFRGLGCVEVRVQRGGQL